MAISGRQRSGSKTARDMVPLLFLAMLTISPTSGQDTTPVAVTQSPVCPSFNPVINNYAEYVGVNTCCTSRPRDCADVKDAGHQHSGRYTVTPDDGEGSFPVYCDMDTNGGGWTVIQRRENGFVDFYRPWAEYKSGFGLVVGEHWLGNDKIHRLTSQKRYVLRVEVSDWEGGVAYAEYDLFIVLGEDTQYQLIVGSYRYRGTAGDSLVYHNGKPFSTLDADHDTNDGNCAVLVHGAWWYSSCHVSNLNGRYYGSDEVSTDQARGISWRTWKGTHYTMKTSEMKIRPA